ncbi:putative uncharacterized protein [Waddlia chondrophila 2032/99]|uniref:Uncharacterized protein n=2 Tax=Waddlia chondrophila TaxID=71667 RepID=D6YUX7_WADCW|nr:hypothetical protein [Waddlia chondrophila]ADI37938.1 hypothetical protein wcw_0568 [Waddlia chondrophila WSU 86-1044]CCB91314.1 putative uncharacterized protein [Waddlia chondrophila 2032/99]
MSITPILHAAEGRREVRKLYKNEERKAHLKEAIKTVYSTPLAVFLIQAQKPDGLLYDYNIHSWRKREDSDTDEKLDRHKASIDFLVDRVEKLAKKFVEGTEYSEENVRSWLQYKLGLGQFKNTSDFIEKGQATFTQNHIKLSRALTKIYENRFLGKKEKAQKKNIDEIISNSADVVEDSLPLDSHIASNSEKLSVEATDQTQKKQSAIVRFFIRIGNGIKQSFISIWNFLRRIFRVV